MALEEGRKAVASIGGISVSFSFLRAATYISRPLRIPHFEKAVETPFHALDPLQQILLRRLC